MKNSLIFCFLVTLQFSLADEISYLRYYANEKNFIANVPMKATNRRGYDHLTAYFNDRNLPVKLEYYISNGSLKKREIMEYNSEFLWVHHIGFHTYSYRVFMYNEFHTIEKFDDGAPFKGGMDLLKFYSFDTVDVGRPRPPHLIPSPRQASPDHCCIPLPCYIHPLTVPHPLTMLLYPRARWAATSAPSSAGASSSRSASPSSYASSTPDVAEGCKKGWWDTRRGAAGDGRKSVVGRAAGAVRSG